MYLKALEFVVWAALSMESSVPLLTITYLDWRSTLYTAVCQCYYDCKSAAQAEVNRIFVSYHQKLPLLLTKFLASCAVIYPDLVTYIKDLLIKRLCIRTVVEINNSVL